MDLYRITIHTTEEGLDLVGYALDEVGLTQYEMVEDAAAVQRFLDETAAFWDYIEAESVLSARQPCVRAYVPENETGRTQLAAVRARIEQLKNEIIGIDAGSLTVEVDTVHEEDWANNWKQYYKPTPIGGKLLVKPSWEDAENAEGRIVLNMDPGMVFGTGTHETTQLSLLALEEYVQPGMRVLDLGCGSGILSIGALLLGAQSILGVDIDPNAADIAYVNLEDNGIARDRAQYITGNVLEDEELPKRFGDPYDIVVANIVANVIIPLSEKVPAMLKPKGLFITSGIISDREIEVRDALEKAGLNLICSHRKNDWICLIAQKQ